MATPAGFWRRYLAYSLDAALLAPLLAWLLWPRLQAIQQQFLLDLAVLQWRLLDLIQPASILGASPLGSLQGLANDPELRTAIADMAAQLTGASLQLALLIALAAAPYFIGFEASPWRATPGKRLLGMQVVDRHGGRAPLARVVLRFCAGGLSWLSLNLGHALAAWTPGKRALHDLIAGTRVEIIGAAALPRWARYLLAAQAGLMLGLLFIGAYRYWLALRLAMAAGLL